MEFESMLEEFQGIVDLRARIRAPQSTQKVLGGTTHLDILCGIDLLVDTLFRLDVDGREGGLQRDPVSDGEIKGLIPNVLPSCRWACGYHVFVIRS
jgi:hypothetical protein